jgi:hypothetical protein
MAITNSIPEVWSAQILTTLEKSAVYGAVSNRNYEGEISEYGDSVHITDIADPTISPYSRNVDLSDPEVLTDNEQLLLIDQANSFNIFFDDLDKAQARNAGGLVDEAAKRAAWGLRDQADKFLATKMAGAGFGLGLVDASSSAANFYDSFIVPASVRLDEQNVPEEQRWAVVSPSTYGKLQLDDRFIKAAYSGTGAIHNGMVGDAGGFRIYKSNNAPQSNRAETAITTVSGAKSLTGVAGQFSQGDIGLSVTGTGVGSSSVIASVNATGSVAMSSVNSSASAAVTVTVAGGGQLAIAGSSIATTFAEQILKVVPYSPEKRFGDALKGLHVFGGSVVRPEALVVSSVKI